MLATYIFCSLNNHLQEGQPHLTPDYSIFPALRRDASLNEHDRTMEYNVISASNTPFEVCIVGFTTTLELKVKNPKLQ
jgi:hypothetical protein